MARDSPALVRTDLKERLAKLLGAEVVRLESLHGGMVADVRLAELDDRRRMVAKSSENTPLAVEGRMLTYLASVSSLPVPVVHYASDDLLVLEELEGESAYDVRAERHAAELLAELHRVAPYGLTETSTVFDAVPETVDEPGWGSPARERRRFGFYFDTLIGPFPQENAWRAEWPAFFRERRLEPMLAICLQRGRLARDVVARLERVLGDLDNLLDHAPTPGLVHGDVWAGNVLAKDGRVSGFLDPALYFADPEVELAFIELFGTFGSAFWERYRSLRVIGDDYRSYRRDVYQLYPLLVHVALFGGGYVAGVGERLGRLGY